MTTCPHEWPERETAIADGYCPLCLAADNARKEAALRALVNRVQASKFSADITDPYRAFATDELAAARAALAPETKGRGPYRPDELRVVEYLAQIVPDVGAGDDPIGFLISSHHALTVRGARGRPSWADGNL